MILSLGAVYVAPKHLTKQMMEPQCHTLTCVCHEFSSLEGSGHVSHRETLKWPSFGRAAVISVLLRAFGETLSHSRGNSQRCRHPPPPGFCKNSNNLCASVVWLNVSSSLL